MKFRHASTFAASVRDVFAFHERPTALELLLPPWESVRNVRPAASLEAGSVARLEQRVGPFWIEIVAEHTAYERDALFVDEMRKGPFAAFRHEHRFSPAPGGGCVLEDVIEFEPPFGVLGRWAAPLAVVPRLRRMFTYRHNVTREAVEPSQTLQD